MVAPKKHLGQHFLTDEKIAQKVASLQANIEINHAIEIGCGKGVLTKYLVNQQGKKLIALDIDSESIEYMHANYPAIKEQIILADFLTYDLSILENKISVIGNFPYNISSQIVFKILDNIPKIVHFAGMFQKEVAERLCAKEGSKTYGILSVLLSTYFDTKYEFTVNEGAFFPAPKVKSGVISACIKENFSLPIPYIYYKNVIKTAFNQRRKMLRNSLATYQIDKLEDKTYFTFRPEQLNFAQFIHLSEMLYQIK